MSLRYWYRKPSKERICPRCGVVIDRNLTVVDGEPWHYGCYREAEKKRFLCLGCGAELSELQTIQVDYSGIRKRSCGMCGSTMLDSLRRRAAPMAGIIEGGMIL